MNPVFGFGFVCLLFSFCMVLLLLLLLLCCVVLLFILLSIFFFVVVVCYLGWRWLGGGYTENK